MLHVLRRPLFLAALALLAVNDHLLKGAALAPSWFTGKASDFAGLLIAPTLLALLLRLRTRRAWWSAHLAIAWVFIAIKLDADAARRWDALLGGSTVVDPSDLLALPMLVLSAWTFTPCARAPRHASQPLSSLPIAVVALLFCAGSSRHANLTQNAKAPTQRYRELGSIPIRGSEAMSFEARQLATPVECAAVLADPSALRPEQFEAEAHGGLVETFAQPIENGDVRALEGRACGALLVRASTSEWFGFSQFELAPTFVVWDRRAVLEAQRQAPPNAEIGLVELRKDHGTIVIETRSPWVKLVRAKHQP